MISLLFAVSPVVRQMGLEVAEAEHKESITEILRSTSELSALRSTSSMPAIRL
ncbi:MAG: hypothetical protein U0521_22810 [Anaerolineae bacterium]